MTKSTSLSELKKSAFIAGSFNGIINGFINWFSFKDMDQVLVSDNLISSTEPTLLAGAVPLAVSLAFILSGIAYLSAKIPNKPKYFPKIFLLSLKHTFMAFGIAVTFGVMWQRWMGSIEISPIIATICMGLTAWIVGSLVNYLTIKEIICDEVG
ncbi:hypothetical protein FHS59_004644 [Algoriphagus iocasae]|uniref:Uncharacterized protein n=1 Tax=Algoriphagus iocasae TaxID=1836499 RepID=A0A841MND0_9BACT|nr:hypothetical protein [Algoriphagus iocasae]MBB6328980.1 hypothetical protein [Algoriphagus iocasae]